MQPSPSLTPFPVYGAQQLKVLAQDTHSSPEGSMCCNALMVETYWCRMSVVAAPGPEHQQHIRKKGDPSLQWWRIGRQICVQRWAMAPSAAAGQSMWHARNPTCLLQDYSFHSSTHNGEHQVSEQVGAASTRWSSAAAAHSKLALQAIQCSPLSAQSHLGVAAGPRLPCQTPG